VLVGGRSSRMGRDKARLPFRGSTLAQWVAAQVARAAGCAFLVGDPLRYGDLGYPVIADNWPGEGPLSGIITALRHRAAPWLLVVACDMPGLTAAFLGELLAAAKANGSATIPTSPGGRMEPLCAVWHGDALPALEKAFAAGTRKIADAVMGIRPALYPVTAPLLFQNINTPEDLAAHAAK